MNQYRILRWPAAETGSAFVYFKHYKMASGEVALPAHMRQDIATLAPRTLQLMRFDSPFEMDTLQRYFSKKLQQPASKIYTGSFKPKKSGVRKKRAQVFFALIVYKSASSVDYALESVKLIQKTLDRDHGVRKNNIGLDVLAEMESETAKREREEAEREAGKSQEAKILESEGFQVVTATKGGAHKKRAQGRTGKTVGVMDEDFLEKHEVEQKVALARELEETEAAQQFLGMRRGSLESMEDGGISAGHLWIKRRKKKRKVEQGFPDFYKFQVKEQKHSELAQLKKTFHATQLKIKRKQQEETT